ncbi:MAG: hypothetical protein C7B46_13180 [Sulfobacillus benefaciens]|uniref:Uncharacterized protein n=1 Tax=Sulfobacillus benefaciens TaxID=453960 RepID=A0A2T2XE24_9FIRM|nr:MAG: hypothetical protein C7B46_13180 [Sulfobacillus benefaciens]
MLALSGILVVTAGCGAASGHDTASGSSRVVKHTVDHPGNQPFITLNPTSGRPGSIVTVTGYIPSVKDLSASDRAKLAPLGNIGFGGFNTGLTIDVSAITWSSQHPGYFTAKFQVPTQPWLTPQGEHALKPGVYPVAIQCFGPMIHGCALGPSQTQADFRLMGPIATQDRPISLKLSPVRGAPGTSVHVSGWAPLTEIIGQPFGYQLVWNAEGKTSDYGSLGSVQQSFNGDISGSFKVPASVAPLGSLQPGPNSIALQYIFTANPGTSITLGHAPFNIIAPRTWAALGTFHPLYTTTNQAAFSFSQPSPVTVSDGTIAVSTTPGAIWLRQDGVWQSISLSALTSLSSGTGYPVTVFPGSPPLASSIALAPGFPSTLFLAVEAVNHQYGSAPPMYNTPYYTTDLGKSWNQVPVPPGYTVGEFGGYLQQESAVVAYFIHDNQWATETTDNGGQSWTMNQHLPKPELGSALNFGAVPNENFGQMGNGQTEQLLRDTREGQWISSTSFTTMEGTTTLAALSVHSALLLQANNPYPVQLTENGGKTWQYIALPPITGSQNGSNYQDLGMLANGDILAQVSLASGSGWFVLTPGASHWQSVPTTVIPPNTYNVTIVGKAIWWIASSGSTTTPPTLVSVNQSRL